MTAPISPSVIEALRRLDACTLANTIESFDERLRNEGFADKSIRCFFPELGAMAGHAVTVQVRGANPPVGARTYMDRTDWWDYILSVPAPRVVVLQDVSSKPGLGALLGSVHVSILRALGCVGAVTNGAVRDLPAVKKSGFQLFAGGPSVSHAYIHIVATGTPVTVGGLTVASGDILHGDLHGVQTVPADLAAKIPAAAAKLTAEDEALIALCQSPGFNLAKLRAAVSGHNS